MIVKDRDCGDETDQMHAVMATHILRPVCPKCGYELMKPQDVRSNDTSCHMVTCVNRTCQQPVIGQFFGSQWPV